MKLNMEPKQAEDYRASTAKQPAYVHQRRKCPCGGKVATAKELDRYGMREKCWESR